MELITNTAVWHEWDIFYLEGRGDTKFMIKYFAYHTGVKKWFCFDIDNQMFEVDDGLLKKPKI